MSIINGELVRHNLRDGGHSCGALLSDMDSRHAYAVPVTFCDDVLVSKTQPPCTFCSVGGKRPKSHPKAKSKPTKTNMTSRIRRKRVRSSRIVCRCKSMSKNVWPELVVFSNAHTILLQCSRQELEFAACMCVLGANTV